MKAFIASLVILALLLVSSVLNCLYIDRLTGKLLALEACFPDKAEEGILPPSAAILEAEALWESSRPRLLAAAKAGYITAVTTALRNTRDFYENGTPADYIAARRMLIEAVTALRVSDSLRFSSII